MTKLLSMRDLLLTAEADHGLRLSPRTIHFYTSSGLLPKPQRGPGGGYHEECVFRLYAIDVLGRQGQSLDQIKVLFAGRSEAQIKREVEKVLQESAHRIERLRWLDSLVQGIDKVQRKLKAEEDPDQEQILQLLMKLVDEHKTRK